MPRIVRKSVYLRMLVGVIKYLRASYLFISHSQGSRWRVCIVNSPGAPYGPFSHGTNICLGWSNHLIGVQLLKINQHQSVKITDSR